MSKVRHVYRPPRGRFSGVLAILGGVVATIGVFVAIPLSQKLAEQFSDPIEAPEELTVEPPEDELLTELEPPPEEEPEPPPEDPVEEPADLDLGLEIADLSMGTGGGFVMTIPKFGLRGGDDPFGAGDLDTPPQPTSKLPPTYPGKALREGRGGRTLVLCSVNQTGKVVSSRIRKSSGHRDLDNAALKTVRRWKFKPAIRGGKPITASCVVPFNFEVKK